MGDLMKDDYKTKKQLINELTELRSQNAELQRLTAEGISAELAAEEARRYAESIVGTVREPLLVLDGDLKIISATRNFYSTFQVSSAETIGSFIYDLGNKQWDIPRLRELLEEVLPEEDAFDDFEVDHNFQDIGHKIMLLNARQIYRKDIGTKMILLAIEDITEHKRMENLLTESEERYRQVFETASDGIVLIEKSEGKITHANQAIKEMLGYSSEESAGKKLQDIGIVDIDDFQTLMQILDESGITNYTDVPIKTKSGRYIDTDIYFADRARLVQCNIRDISKRKQAEEMLKRSEEKFRFLTENMRDNIFTMDLNLRTTYVSQSIKKILGFTPEERMEQHIAEQVTPASMALIEEILSAELEREQKGLTDLDRSIKFEVEFYHKDGSTVWMENMITGIRDESGVLVGIHGVSRDISERKRTEGALRESEEKYRFLADRIADIVWTSDLGLNTTYLSPSVEFVLGNPPEARMKIPFQDTVTPVTYARMMERLAEEMAVEEGGQANPDRTITMEMEYYHCNGSTIWMENNISAIRNEKGQLIGLQGMARDITDRKRSEEKLHQTLDRLKEAFGTIIQVMVTAVETRDPYTAGHQKRSANLARAIATEMGLSQDKIDGISMAGVIHDIGKMSVPAEILSKPTQLSELELPLVMQHAQTGYEMLKHVESPWPLAEMVYQHHERMDGSGYPRQLKGEEILMEARILAVADVVESMASHRPYRAALGLNAALEEIENNKGTLYDADAVDACLKLFREKGFQLERT